MSLKDTTVLSDIKRIVQSLGDHSALLEGKVIVVTGGSGFLGKYIIDTLVYLNSKVLLVPCKIISIDNYITSSTEGQEGSKRHIKYINHNVVEPISIKGRVDYIIHAAGIASPIYYQKYPLETIDVAVLGTRNMLELAKEKKVKSFLYFSSSEIYGDPTPDFIPTKETYKGNVSSIGPRSCYDESKRLGETLCTVYHNLYQIPVKIVRPFNVYGPGMGPFDHRVIPTFIYRALMDQPIPVHSSGNQTRTFCYISDAVTGFYLVLLAGKAGEAYNVGNQDDEITMNKLATTLDKVFENKLIINNIKYPKGYPQDEPQRRCPDIFKIHEDVGFQTKISLKLGLSKTVNWCKRNWF